MYKKCGKCLDRKSFEDFGKNTKGTFGLHGYCKPCQSIAFKTWKQNNREKYKALRKDYYITHKEEISAYSKLYWESNASQYAARSMKRYTSKLQRTPKWLTTLDWEKIQEFYDYAALMTEVTGIRYEVDHIIPLQGKQISGLHCPENLQIITKSENCKKHNTFISNNR